MSDQSLQELYGTNKELEINGVNLDFGPASIRIRRAGGANRKYIQLLSGKTKPYRRQIDNETMDMDLLDKIYAEVYADTIILGWSGNIDGNNTPYSRDACVKLLIDYPDLFNDIQDAARKFSTFQAEELERSAKN